VRCHLTLIKFLYLKPRTLRNGGKCYVMDAEAPKQVADQSKILFRGLSLIFTGVVSLSWYTNPREGGQNFPSGSDPRSSVQPSPPNPDDPSAISTVAKDCLQRLKNICHALQCSPTTESLLEYDRDFALTTMQDALNRFNAWGTNIAAFHNGLLEKIGPARNTTTGSRRAEKRAIGTADSIQCRTGRRHDRPANCGSAVQGTLRERPDKVGLDRPTNCGSAKEGEIRRRKRASSYIH
jgi:hypothetical protein